eukprot:GDKI01040519.1.p1 GENE.GDKI01040519.1~~GDKI01040519.1.p1  ORF type:complete len:151 (-),score=63.13 GDKI01040519.1:23-412(-)
MSLAPNCDPCASREKLQMLIEYLEYLLTTTAAEKKQTQHPTEVDSENITQNTHTLYVDPHVQGYRQELQECVRDSVKYSDYNRLHLTDIFKCFLPKAILIKREPAPSPPVVKKEGGVGVGDVRVKMEEC